MRPTIESGTTVSHYRVLSPLGAGGMGEVYKAHDNTLERAVALKILPPHLVRNEERVRRFIQEAKSASSLNHPHIVTIHEIGEAVVSSSDRDAGAPTSLHYIAMELIDGVTLKKKIHDEQTDLRTLLSYVAQAAEGLAKAHQAGIVHRDLKPENIMVTRDGFAKVLDFGLAKLNVKKAAPEGHTQATAVRDETREGALLGTVAYMSPEQVQGKTVDHRTDIFAFGAILYEAATRRRPFEADSDVDVMHKILHDKPAPVEELSPNVPAELRRMIRRCLAKEPEKRFQSMKDIALELTEIVDEFEQLSVTSSTRGSSSATGPVLAPPPRRAMWIALSLVGAAAIAGIAFGLYQWRKSAGRHSGFFETMQLRRLTASGNIVRAAVSPDGKYVAYALRDDGGHQAIWVRQVATGSDVQVVPPGPERFAGLAFSPDGNYLYYSRTESDQGATYSWLFSVPALGGTPRKLLFDVDTAVAFSPDGKRIAFGRGVPQTNENHLVVANADGTGERKVVSLQRFVPPSRPVWSPDGSKVITSTVDVSTGWTAYPVEVDVASGAQRRVGTTRWFYVDALAFTPDGRSLVFPAADAETARAQIWMQPYPDGQPVRVTNDLNDYRELTMSQDGGAITALQEQTETELRISAVDDASGGKVLVPTPNQRIEDVVVAAASGTVAYSFISGNTAHVGIVDGPGSPPRVLTREGENFDGTISADGRTIVFQSERGTDPPHLFAIDADGSNVRQITTGSGEVSPVLSADGRMVVYRHQDQSLWMKPLAGGTPRRISASVNGPAAISPESQRIAFLEWRTTPGSDRAANHLMVVPVAGGRPLLDIPWRSGGRLRWHPREDGITSRRFAGGADNIFLQPIAGGPPKQLTKFTSGYIPSFDWMADGRLVFALGRERSDVVLITNGGRAE